MYKTEISRLKEAIRNSDNICVFTGAGISCPSGIPDFRSADGLYNSDGIGRFSPEEIISHSFFIEKPLLFFDFYKSKMVYPEARPNAAHIYFADLEKAGKKVSIVTQNIDGLHLDAGNTTVFEIHGSVRRNHCTKCGAFYDEKYICNSDGIPLCSKCNSIIKPDVVLYEEGLDDDTVAGAINAIASSDLLIIIGTSLAVYPAASFIQFFKGKTTALINKSSTSFDKKADIVINDDVIKVVSALSEN